MKKKLKIALLTVLTAISVLAVCLFAGCKVDYAAIYNDDAKIITYSGYTSVNLTEIKTSSKYSCKCSKFSGVNEIKKFTVESGSELDVKLNVESGDFKLVLTNSDNVYVLKEGSYDGAPLTFENIPEGSYRLKMVGVAAKVDLQINF